MGKKTITISIILCVIAAAVIFVMTRNSISSHILELQSPDSSIQDEAALSLIEIGPEAIPELITSFQDMNYGRRDLIAGLLGKIGQDDQEAITVLINTLNNKEEPEELRLACLLALGDLGPADSSSVTALINVMQGEDPTLKNRASEVLIKMGPEVAPALVESIKVYTGVSAETVDILVKIGPEVVPALTQGLKSEKWEVRTGCIFALEKLGPEANISSQILVNHLGEPRRDTVRSVIRILERREPDFQLFLLNVLDHKDRDVRVGVLRAMGNINPLNDEALKALRELLKDHTIISLVAKVLTGSGNPKTVPMLIDTLNDKSWQMRGGAAFTLGYIGQDAKKAVPDLTRCLKDENDKVCTFAAIALGKIGTQSLPVFIKILKSKESRLHVAAVKGIVESGSKAEKAVPALIKALAHGDLPLRQNAAEALGEIGPAAEAAVPYLVKALKDPDTDIRVNAARSLGEIGSLDAYDPLVDAQEDPEFYVRSAAQGALTALLLKYPFLIERVRR